MARRSDRFGATQGLGSILEQEKRRIYDDATPAKREAFLEAERAREVYRAWNTVCARTREGQHVCGLHFVPETRELVVYVDGSPFCARLSVRVWRRVGCASRPWYSNCPERDMKLRARRLPLRTRSSPRPAQVCLEPSFPLPMSLQSMLVFPISRMKVFKERLNPRWVRGFR